VIVATGGNIKPVVQVFPSNNTAKLLTMVVPSTGSAATAFWLKLKVQDKVSILFNNEIVVCLLAVYCPQWKLKAVFFTGLKLCGGR